MHTISSLINDFENIGIAKGMNLIVHSSLKAVGEVCGGASSVIIALEQVLGGEGTLAMPAHTSGLTDPAGWSSPPAPESDWEIIRAEMPPFEPDLTPTRNMGFIPETFRKQNGVLRSYHPHVSWVARGKHAEYITSHHSLEMSSGENSPLARLYELDAWILLLGVGNSVNTSLHLAECRQENIRERMEKAAAPMIIDNARQWVEFNDVELNDDDFEKIGNEFEKSNNIKKGTIGEADSKLMQQKAIVDFAVEWMRKNTK